MTADEIPQVGVDKTRVDASEKIRGEAMYAGDIEVPRMLHGKLLRSPIAHAKITAINLRDALEIPGVVAVLTGQDLRDIDAYFGHAVRDRPIVAIDRVRFAGEPVA